METQVTEISAVKRRVEVTVAKEEVDKQRDRTYNKLKQQVQLKGFRKGKVPINILKQHYSKDVEQEVLGEVINKSLVDFLEQNDSIQPVAFPVLEQKELRDSGEVFYELTMEVKPELEISGYKGLKLKSESKKPGDKEVKNVITRLQEQQAKLKEKDAKTPEKTDFVGITIQVFVGDEEYEEAKLEDSVVPLGKEQLIPEIEEAVLKLSVGETGEAKHTFPEDFTDEKLKGNEATFKVTLNSIKEQELPELNDEFAKATGQAETLADLNKQILENLTKEVEEMEKRELEGKAIEQILSANPFELPPALIDERTKYLKNQYAQQGWQQGKDKEQDEKVEKAVYDRAVNEVRADLALEAIAKTENITASDQDVQDEIDKMLEGQPGDNQRMREFLQSEERQAAIRDQIMRRKTLDFIVANATIG